jgi:tRNA nucleotidyltransferase/poly(A) polymerase
VLSYTKALGVIFPEIDALKNVQEIPEHHPEETTYNHTLLTLEFADKENLSQIVKYALLFHDVGKLFTPKDVLPHHYGHEEAGLSIIDKQKIPNDYKDFAKMACKYHMILRRFYEMKPGHIYDVMYDITKGFRYFIPLKLLFQVSEADLYGRGKEPREERKNQFDKSQEIAYNMYDILEKVSASDFQELIDKSDKLSGKEFGELYRVKLIQYYCERSKYANKRT